MTFDCGLSLLFLMNRQRYRLITEPRRRRRRFGDDGGGRGRSTLRSSSLSGTGSEGRKEREISLVQVSGELELKDSSNEIVCKPPSLPLSLPLLRWPATRADSGSAVMQWDGRTDADGRVPFAANEVVATRLRKVLVTRFLPKRNL